MKKKRKRKKTYINLAQHGKTNTIVDLAKRLNLVVGARVLAAKLVAGETENLKVVGVLGLEFLVQLLEAFKLGCEAAFGRRVHDQDDFAVELGEVVGFAFFCCEGRAR